MIGLAERVDPIVCAHALEAQVRELRLIAAHKPRYNRRSKFPERSVWLKLTVEAFPRLSIVRETARLNELAIITAGRRWAAQIEWWVHARSAIEVGLPKSVVEHIRALTPPVFDERADYEVYEFSRELQTTGRVSEATYAAVMRRWGARGVVELTAVIGYYTMVAMTLNAHRIPVPEAHKPLPETGSLAELPSARLSDGVNA